MHSINALKKKKDLRESEDLLGTTFGCRIVLPMGQKREDFVF